MTLFRDNNKLLFPLLGLALFSSGGLSTSALSFRLSLPLSLSRGGGNPSLLFNSISFKSPDKVLNLESQNASNYKFSLPEAKSLNQSLKIKTPQESLALIENLDIGETKKLIPAFFKESGKEGQILSIQAQARSAIEEQTKKTSSRKEHFSSAFSSVKNYGANRRKRREEASPDNLTLTKEHKAALKHFYESFYSLETTQKSLLKQFSELSGTSLPSEAPTPGTKEKSSWEKLKQALEDMNWEADDLALFGGTLGKDRKDNIGDIWSWNKDKIECTQDRDCGWGSWEKNPYNSFYLSREKWKESVQKITDPQKKLHEMTTQPKWVFCGIVALPFGSWGQSWCGSVTKEQLKKKIQEAKYEFNYEISSKFLEWMGRDLSSPR